MSGADEIAGTMAAWVVFALVVPPGRRSFNVRRVLPTPFHSDR